MVKSSPTPRPFGVFVWLPVPELLAQGGYYFEADAVEWCKTPHIAYRVASAMNRNPVTRMPPGGYVVRGPRDYR